MFQGNTQIQHNGLFSADVAMQGARAEAGLLDFGDDSFVDPLHQLIERVQTDVTFSPPGWLSFRASIQRYLVNRLRFIRDVTRHPEILQEDVSDPIVVLGMPRTGTTKLQRLMSADPRMQKLALWRLLNPAPFDGDAPGVPGGRMEFARMVEEATRVNPDFTMAHETSAVQADEDSYLLLPTFDYVMLYNVFPSASYLAWVRARPHSPAHEFEKKMLQYLQWQDGGRRGRRWVLKNPGHIGHLKAVHTVFPRATFVHSHRDMLEVIPSYCRLMEALYAALLGPYDLHRLGREVLEYWAPEVERYVADRAELQDRIKVLDVPYLDIVRSPMATIRQAYANAGVAFTAESDAAMRAWSDANRQHKHGRSEYSLERYGLTKKMIAQSFPHAMA